MRDKSDILVTSRTLLLAIVLLVAFAGLLHLSGQPPWCKHGLGLWSDAWSHCTSQHLLDPYTLSHVLHGVIFYWLLCPLARRIDLQWRLVAALALEIGWELFENSPWVIEHYRQHTASLDYVGDSVLNALADVLAAIVGFAFASRFSWQASVILFIVLELAALYIARDNLTLNVLMLFLPIESIKEWQLSAIAP